MQIQAETPAGQSTSCPNVEVMESVQLKVIACMTLSAQLYNDVVYTHLRQKKQSAWEVDEQSAQEWRFEESSRCNSHWTLDKANITTLLQLRL